MKINNLFHNVPTGPNPPEEVYCIVEVPKGSSNKYEYDLDYCAFHLDRALYSAVFFPTEYGIVPQTWGKDGDPLDIMVVSSFSTFPGCVLTCCPIALLKINDTRKGDNKIIAVPKDDPRFEGFDEVGDLNPHFKKEIENFWENYSELQPNKEIRILGWSGRKAAQKAIQEGIKAYQAKFSQ